MYWVSIKEKKMLKFYFPALKEVSANISSSTAKKIHFGFLSISQHPLSIPRTPPERET